MRVHRRVAGVILGQMLIICSPSEALDARRRLYQRTVHTEVLVRPRSLSVRCPHHFVEQRLSYLASQQAPPVLHKPRWVEAALDQVHIQELSEQKAVFEHLAERSIRTEYREVRSDAFNSRSGGTLACLTFEYIGANSKAIRSNASSATVLMVRRGWSSGTCSSKSRTPAWVIVGHERPV